ncbi:LPS export ABC transporter periplasmic protein LptC [Pontibaca salina]|uniref:LPS export ABC transporter periplasmic protein LptC n=1 Tax=Pontibaca salina TaxID=2795731 RepID=A0A934HQ05_9RHOB|nr:LPS export ABC transporter periplasmic protein LptC [Pontibaca salina]MBI6628470.1 LPS export ABC transporter periplasmic protein LptC [Pontibaca salina]
MDLYSRCVALFKVLLPLAALAILATLFLLSRGVDFTATPFAQKDLAERMRDQQITAPYFSGVTPEGDEIMFKAGVVRPGSKGAPAEADDLSAKITLVDGAKITLKSQKGSIDMRQDLAHFKGDVRITTSTGYVVTTDQLDTALSGVAARTPGPVAGTGPLGDFTAGGMTLKSETPGASVHMHFNRGVRMIYHPQKPKD